MTRRSWTAQEITILRELYPTTRARDIAVQLPGRTITQILSKAWALGLRKPVEIIAQHAREAMSDPTHPARKRQFKPGHRTWNSGMKGWKAGGRSADTRFKPGQMSGRAKALLQPIGAERETKDGILQRKVTHEGRGGQRWKSVHQLIWIEAHGPIPPRHIVVFKDGNRRNFDLTNLECIPMAENMRRNTVHNLPKPVAELVQLRAALVRKINHRNKKTDHAQK
jgi:hypothetical protein